jgi:hypothetical protein
MKPKDARGASRRGTVARALRTHFSRWVSELQADTPRIWKAVEQRLAGPAGSGGAPRFQSQPMQQQQKKAGC